MSTTTQNEYGLLNSVCLHKAESAFVNDEKLETEWKALGYLGKPNYKKACEEFNAFEEILRNEGIVIDYFPGKGLSIDAIYCRDAAIATDHGMIIANMGKHPRKGEPEAQLNYFKSREIDILGSIKPPGTLEGGDVIWLDPETLAVGHSYRTNFSGIEQLKALLSPLGIKLVVVSLPHYKGPDDVFHLMSIISPVDRDLAVVYSPLMPVYFRDELINRGYSLVEVADEEFETLGCNVLAIGPRKCVLVKGNPKVKKELENHGCEVLEYAGKEISLKGGGGPTCLTRPLWRKI